MSGTWVVNELIDGEWQIPCFPEITLEILNKFKYMGVIIEKNKNG